MRTQRLITLMLGIAISAMATAQTVHTNPDRVTEELFWGQLYAEGGTTLYCQADFGPTAILTTVSHIYDLAWARDELRCPTARTCRGKTKPISASRRICTTCTRYAQALK